MTYQLPLLNGINLPICPTCHRETHVLGQWSPSGRLFVCRDCMSTYGPPDGVFVPHDNSVGVGLRQEPQYAKERELYHRRAQVLEELAKGCIYTIKDIDEQDNLPCTKENDLYLLVEYHVNPMAFQRPIYVDMRLGCRRCQNRLRYVMQQRSATINFKERMRATLSQTASLPICARCGSVHDNRTLSGDAAAYCQHCDDMNAVESFWQHRGIFGGEDDESILDRLQKSHPGLFERGVLPDGWFILRAKEQS